MKVFKEMRVYILIAILVALMSLMQGCATGSYTKLKECESEYGFNKPECEQANKAWNKAEERRVKREAKDAQHDFCKARQQVLYCETIGIRDKKCGCISRRDLDRFMDQFSL